MLGMIIFQGTTMFRLTLVQDTTMFGLIWLQSKKTQICKVTVEKTDVGHSVDPRSIIRHILLLYCCTSGALAVWCLSSNAISINSVDPGVRIPPWWECEFSKGKRNQLLRAWVSAIRRESTRQEWAEVFSL